MHFFPTLHLVNSSSPFKTQLINDDFPKYLSAEQLLGLSGLAAPCPYLCCSTNPSAVESSVSRSRLLKLCTPCKQRPDLVTFIIQNLAHYQQGRCEKKEQNNHTRGVWYTFPLDSAVNCPEHCPIPTLTTVKRKKEPVAHLQ